MQRLEHLWTALNGFVEQLKLDEYAGNSIRGYHKDISLLLEFLENESLPWDKSSLIAYKKTLQERLKPSSINRKIAAINRFLAYLGDQSLTLKQLRVQENSFASTPLTRSQFESLMKTALSLNENRLAMIMLTLASTGIRVSELGFFTVESVNTGFVAISNKKKERIIPLPTDLQQSLREYCQAYQVETGPIFANQHGLPLSRSYIAAKMKSIAEQAGIPKAVVFPHNLRHYFARQLLEQGYPLTDLADHLGHQSIDTTRQYLKISAQARQEQLSRVTVFSGLPLLRKNLRMAN